MASGVSLVTDGWICPIPKDKIFAVTCDAPAVSRTIEVRPTIRAADADEEAPSPAGEPRILSAEDLRPVVTSVDAPATGGAATEPRVLSASDLKPVIREAEEE